VSRILAMPTRPVPSDGLLWGTCPLCLTEHYTLTTTGRLPEHPVPGYGPNRPQCAGTRHYPVPGSVEPAQTCFNATGNYGVVQRGAAA
jgi:hypothetical protein